MLIKVCGISDGRSLEAVVQGGATAVGFNFYHRSPRYVTVEQVLGLLPFTGSLLKVGVFVDPPMEEAVEIVNRLKLDGIQLHGMTMETLRKWQGSLQPLWVAFAVANKQDVDDMAMTITMLLSQKVPLEKVLVDAKVPGEHGGTGRKAPWELLIGMKLPVPWILAGGLKPDNVAEAIRLLHPDGVDVASGVEKEPGKKDPGLILQFCRAAREAGQR